MDTCTGCHRLIDTAFDPLVHDSLGRPWHAICMTRARGATGGEDQPRGAGPLWAWAILTLLLPVVGLVAGIVYLFRNRIGPGLALIIEAAAVMLVYLALVSSASAWVAPNQQPAPPVITELVDRAQVFWQEHGVSACPGGVMAWEAPALSPDDDVWGRGDGATCEIWVSRSLVDYALYPMWLGNGIAACTAVVHEVGHANGLPHSARGVMAGSGAPERMYGWSPRFCFRWARFTLAAVLRGDGAGEREIRRAIRRDERFIHGTA